MLVPFIDTTKERRPFKRPFPTAFMLLSICFYDLLNLGICMLTMTGKLQKFKVQLVKKLNSI